MPKFRFLVGGNSKVWISISCINILLHCNCDNAFLAVFMLFYSILFPLFCFVFYHFLYFYNNLSFSFLFLNLYKCFTCHMRNVTLLLIVSLSANIFQQALIRYIQPGFGLLKIMNLLVTLSKKVTKLFPYHI